MEPIERNTEFTDALARFVEEYLPRSKARSQNTVEAYRTALTGFVQYLEQKKGIQLQDILPSDVSPQNVAGFFEWLRDERHNSPVTINQRRVPILAFARFLAAEKPELAEACAAVQEIPPYETTPRQREYLSQEEARAFLASIDPKSSDGLRDILILAMLYETGIRASELISLKAGDVHLEDPPTLTVREDSGRTRTVPLTKKLVPYLWRWMRLYRIDGPEGADRLLFLNHSRKAFTRQGIGWIIEKRRREAARKNIDLPSAITPSMFRYAAAMRFLDNGADSESVQGFLGLTARASMAAYAELDERRRNEAGQGVKAAEVRGGAVAGEASEQEQSCSVDAHGNGILGQPGRMEDAQPKEEASSGRTAGENKGASSAKAIAKKAKIKKGCRASQSKSKRKRKRKARRK